MGLELDWSSSAPSAGGVGVTEAHMRSVFILTARVMLNDYIKGEKQKIKRKEEKKHHFARTLNGIGIRCDVDTKPLVAIAYSDTCLHGLTLSEIEEVVEGAERIIFYFTKEWKGNPLNKRSVNNILQQLSNKTGIAVNDLKKIWVFVLQKYINELVLRDLVKEN